MSKERTEADILKNLEDAERRLKTGYIGADFGFNGLQLLKNHVVSYRVELFRYRNSHQLKGMQLTIEL